MESEQLLTVIISIQSGLIKNIELIHEWAESIIAILDKPPLWTMELYDSQTLEEAVGILRMAAGRMAVNKNIDWVATHLGFLYLRFKKGELNFEQLLSMCGEETDLSNYEIDCSYFYSRLNRMASNNLSEQDKQFIYREIDFLLQPMAKIAIKNSPIFLGGKSEFLL
jgi:hypothetical protein